MPYIEKLNGWRRLGTVLTALWCVTVLAVVVIEYFYLFKPGLLVDFDARKYLNGEPASSLQVSRFLAFLIVPPLVVWIAAFIGVFTVKWVAAGFRSDDKHNVGRAELGEFITESLWGILRGLDGVNRRYFEHVKTDEPQFLLQHGADRERGTGVEFDVALVTKEEKEGHGTARTKIWVVEGGVGKSSKVSAEVISRMKFIIYVKNWQGLIGPRPRQQ